MMSIFFLTIFIVILVGIFLLVIAKFGSVLINKLPFIHKKLFNLNVFFLKKKEQRYFYVFEQFKNLINLGSKKYIKANNYFFLIPQKKIKFPKKIKKSIFQIIIIFYTKTSRYFKYTINNKKYNRVVKPNSANFLKIQIPKKNNFTIEENKNDLILKTFNIKKTKKKLVLVLMLDGLSNYLSKFLINSNNFFSNSNRLENVFSNAPWTLPTFSNLLTGMYTSTHLNYKRISFYNNSLSKKNNSTFINSDLTLFEFFNKNDFVTGSYSPYNRINPTYNFDRGVDIFKFCKEESADEIIDNIIAQIEMFNDSSHFIFAHLFDVHHHVKGFKRISDYVKFPEYNIDYSKEIEKKRKKEFMTRLELFLYEKNLYEEKETISDMQYCDLRLNNLYNYLQKKSFDDFTILLLGDHGTRINNSNVTGNILGKNHQNIGFFIKDKKNKSFKKKRKKFMETIDIFPSLLSRYSTSKEYNKLKNKFDGKNTIFSNIKKDYTLSESVYEDEYNSLINLKDNYLYSSYAMKDDVLSSKKSFKFYDKKERLIKFDNKNLNLRKLKLIEKNHMKNIKIKKNSRGL